jgi:hypothetical protein
MGKPFSDLEKQALAIIRGGGNPETSQDEAISNYWKWRMNPNSAAHKLPAASKRTSGRKLDYMSILPFATLPVATQRAKVSISQRSFQGMPPGLKTPAGLKTLTEEPTSLRIGNFKPARVYFRKGAGASSTVVTSRITKREYRTLYASSDEGFSVPFGKTTATDTLSSTQADITAELSAPALGINLITFSPEVYRA